MSRVLNGINCLVNIITKLQPYSTFVDKCTKQQKGERQVQEDIKFNKTKEFFTSMTRANKNTSEKSPNVTSLRFTP
jgi:hypothetical protein